MGLQSEYTYLQGTRVFVSTCNAESCYLYYVLVPRMPVECGHQFFKNGFQIFVSGASRLELIESTTSWIINR